LVFITYCETADAQNITPLPTVFSTDNVTIRSKTPTPIRRMKVEIQRIVGARLEASAGGRSVFSDLAIVSTDSANRAFYYMKPDFTQLMYTGQDGVPGSVILADDGRYMIYLHDESASGRDVDGDGYKMNNVMRMYHFTTGQNINLGIPARSATPMPWENRSSFEYQLNEHVLAFSVSANADNSGADKNAPWHLIDMLNIVYSIEGTPTPTQTATPVVPVNPTSTPTPSPTFTPSPTHTPTLTPTIPPELRSRSDINADGEVNVLDLLIFQMYWDR